MKKFLILILCGVMLFSVTGCGQKKESVDQSEVSLKNLKEALDYYYDKINNTKDDKEKEEYLNKLNDYVLNDLNGYYYYRGTTQVVEKVKSYGSIKYKATTVDDTFDNRAIYVKSKDEVYIVPYTEKELKDKGLKLENLSEIENSELYKYRIVDLHTDYKIIGNGVGPVKYAYVTFESINVNNSSTVENFNTIEIMCSYSDNDKNPEDFDYHFTGYFADLATEANVYNENTKPDIRVNRDYYRDEDTAVNINLQDKADDELADRENDSLKNSIPKIGMTPEEVEKTKWGYPDKINKDTYSWGTTEQWVYNDYGYVYIKNGKVSSVSER